MAKSSIIFSVGFLIGMSVGWMIDQFILGLGYGVLLGAGFVKIYDMMK